MADGLSRYQSMRIFRENPEPRGSVKKARGNLYLIQKHDATRLHYDFRLELDGVLLSWAVTKGPSINPSDKRLAVRTDGHAVGPRHMDPERRSACRPEKGPPRF